MGTTPHKTVDCSGLHCPQPILRSLAGLRGLRRGDTLRVICTDGYSHTELLSLITRLGHELLGLHAVGYAIHYHIRILTESDTHGGRRVTVTHARADRPLFEGIAGLLPA